MRVRTSAAVAASITLLAPLASLPFGAASAAPASPSVTSTAPSAALAARGPGKRATAVGKHGAVSSVDPYATRIGLRVLRRGGNAVDAAVATAAALGVTEPYSAGVGGGGYFVYYDAKSKLVRTIDGRETAPRGITPNAFIDPATGQPYRFSPERVTSGVSVGVPGTPATWDKALRKWGTRDLDEVLQPSARLARKGFVVDQTFHQQTADNAARFAAIRPTSKLFLKGGQPPAVGSVFKNPGLSRTYELLARRGVKAFYTGKLARQMVQTVRTPPKAPSSTLPVPPGSMTRQDLKAYRALVRKPTQTTYRGHTVYGMAPSSSGGTTVGEALNILETFNLSAMDDATVRHHLIEAMALAFADRNAYVGDPAFTAVPVPTLLDDTFARERACAIGATAITKPTTAGQLSGYDGQCATPVPAGREGVDGATENVETTNLTVADRWGNVVEYTLTIEQTGGSGIVVPKRGFLLNNELTDFSAVYNESDPNRIQPGKRPRSSMSPTIVLKGDKPFLALGSPGGATIITTVLQILVDRIDRGVPIDRAVAAPRATNTNTAVTSAEQAFLDLYGAALTARGHQLQAVGAPGTSASEIGAATAIEFGPGKRMTAVAEPTRRGGGAAAVVKR